jgi:hypothetical protein
VVVLQREFIDAVSALPKMKRGPRGSFGNSIPKDTLLYCVDGRLVVFTPAKRTVLGMAGSWDICFSADARRLALVCSKLKSRDFLELSYDTGVIVLNEPAFTIMGKCASVPHEDNGTAG